MGEHGLVGEGVSGEGWVEAGLAEVWPGVGGRWGGVGAEVWAAGAREAWAEVASLRKYGQSWSRRMEQMRRWECGKGL